ncbi:hypothetical protein HYV84_04190 [Candidatus Woesearchaeota archaeon]|nr:hypothetical protein [Candidatus Woesearchaeota archaeon]
MKKKTGLQFGALSVIALFLLSIAAPVLAESGSFFKVRSEGMVSAKISSNNTGDGDDDGDDDNDGGEGGGEGKSETGIGADVRAMARLQKNRTDETGRERGKEMGLGKLVREMAPGKARLKLFLESEFNESDFTAEELAKLGLMGKHRAKGVLSSGNLSNVHLLLGNMKLVKDSSSAMVKRKVMKEKKEKSEKEFRAAKELFLGLNASLHAGRGKLKEAKDELSKCRGEGCEEVEKLVFERAKDFVVNSGEIVLAHFARIKAKVEGDEKLSQEQATAFLEGLAEAEAQVQAGITMATNSTTKVELQAAAKVIANAWAKYKHVPKTAALNMFQGHLGEIVVKSEQLEARLERILEALEEKNVSVADLTTKVDSFGFHVAKAREVYQSSQAKLEDARLKKKAENLTDDDRKAIAVLIQESRDMAQEAHVHLKEAHKILVGIVREAKQADESVSFEAAADEQAVVEVEDGEDD